MAPLIVAAKLESLRASLARIETRTPATAEELAADPDLQESVILSLARAVQSCADAGTHLMSGTDRPVPTTTRGVFEALHALGAIGPETAERLSRAAGLRNLAIHRYDHIDWALVHRVCTGSLDDLRTFAREIEAWLGSRPTDG